MWVLQTVIQVIRPIEKVQLSPPDEGFSDVRVKLCLESNDSWCGDAKLANPQEGENHISLAMNFKCVRNIKAVLCKSHICLINAIFFRKPTKPQRLESWSYDRLPDGYCCSCGNCIFTFNSFNNLLLLEETNQPQR